jgi:hypothetical protein
MDDDECGAVGGMIGRGNWSTWRKPATMSLCSPQIPHDLTSARTRAAAEGSRRLTAWATTRLLLSATELCFVYRELWLYQCNNHIILQDRPRKRKKTLSQGSRRPGRRSKLSPPEYRPLHHWSSTWGTRKHLTSNKTKHRDRLNLEPALILALRKIRPRIEALTCQEQAQWSH